jgi:rhamnulokinase
MAAPYRLAVDLGAGSGRAVLGRFEGGALQLRELHRFHYGARQRDGHLRWDARGLFDGLVAAVSRGVELGERERVPLATIGVDSWAVDYGLIDGEGRLLEEPICYRDTRTDGELARVTARVPRREIFERTGIQFLKLNTLYQLAAHARAGIPAAAERLLLIPDLCHHFLCGSTVSELTNASTTQLLNARTGRWDDELLSRLGLPRRLLPELVPAGQDLGPLRAELRSQTGAAGVRVLAPATHDTASAVAGTPLPPGWAYVSSGTWSLVGIEREAPLIERAVLEADFTNEAGAFGTVRLLKNVMGLWLLERCREEWQATRRAAELPALVENVRKVDGFPGFVYPDAQRFFNPASMLGELHAALQETGQPPVDDPKLLAKIVLDSLALRYASVVDTLERLSGRRVAGIHIVGGGSQNRYLNQATADACGRPVLAGPVEATAIGNLLVQAIAAGDVASLAEGRLRVAHAFPPERYEPSPEARGAWERARARYQQLEAAASRSEG